MRHATLITTLIATLIAVMLLALVAGCSQANMMKARAPSADQQAAKSYIDLLREHKYEQIERDIDPSIKGSNLRDTLTHMAALLPAQDPISVKVVGSNIFNSPGLYRSNITFEYEFPRRWLLANVAIQKKDGMSTIIGFNVNGLSDSLENLNRFTLAGKSPLHYAVLALAILLPLFTLFVLVLCARTRMAKRKWLWILFILFGVGKFAVNWTTGHWGFMPASIQLFSAGMFAPPYGAWTVAVSVPFGAIAFLLRRKHLVKAADRKGLPPSLPTTVA